MSRLNLAYKAWFIKYIQLTAVLAYITKEMPAQVSASHVENTRIELKSHTFTPILFKEFLPFRFLGIEHRVRTFYLLRIRCTENRYGNSTSWEV